MKIRARLAAALAVLSIGAGVVAVQAEPVSAASGVDVCVRSLVSGTNPGAGTNIKTQVWWNGDWHYGEMLTTGGNGCVRRYYTGGSQYYNIRYQVSDYMTGVYGQMLQSDLNETYWITPGNHWGGTITLYPKCIITVSNLTFSPCPNGIGRYW